MSFRLEPLPLSGPMFDGAIAVYGDAFARPPYSDPDRGREVRARLRDTHSKRPGFRGFIAVDDSGKVIALCYGYHGAAGQWWHDTVSSYLDSGSVARWLADSYELVEVAVHPGHQGRGVGAAIIQELLRGRPESTSVLSTRTDSDAHHLYRRLGYEVVTTMAFVPGGPPFHVMGTSLPLRSSATSTPQTTR